MKAEQVLLNKQQISGGGTYLRLQVKSSHGELVTKVNSSQKWTRHKSVRVNKTKNSFMHC